MNRTKANEEFLENLLTSGIDPNETIPVGWIKDYIWYLKTTNNISSMESRCLQVYGVESMLNAWKYRGE